MELFLGETNHDDVFGDYAQITYIQPLDDKEVTKSMISLKNIQLEGITIDEQIQKVFEELHEFIQGAMWGGIDNAIEEYFDVIQSGLGVLYKLGIDAEQVMKEYPKHLEKIKERPRRKEIE
ncbi:hypothetical protein [Clostridium sp.]|uniref:hypothetical protein n=1 Tax=Clostridium sp. TaxID=1506 RepID=UPI003217B063